MSSDETAQNDRGRSLSPLCVLSCAEPRSHVKVMRRRIACLGDSNVEGYRGGLFGFNLLSPHAWPAELQALLGERYEVVNLGSSGATVGKHGRDGCGDVIASASYWDREPFRAFVAGRWDVVIVMIGGNDSKVVSAGAVADNWRGEEAFAKDYAELVALAKALGTSEEREPTVFACTPPPVLCTNAGPIQSTIVNGVLPGLVRRIAAENGAHTVEIFEAVGGGDVLAGRIPPEGLTADFVSANPTSAPAMYFYAEADESVGGVWCDQVHPCDAGFVRIAQVLAEHIRGLGLIE